MANIDVSALAVRLSSVPLFHGLAGAALKRLAKVARTKEVARRDCFFIEGDLAQDFFLLMSGRVKIVQQTSDGGQFVHTLVWPNEQFGGFSALGGPYTVTAEAAEASVALVWPVATIRHAFEHDRRFALNTLDFLLTRLDEVHARCRQFATERVDRRVARILVRLTERDGRVTADGVEIGFPISRQDVAELSGTTLFTVSRLLVSWERTGIVRIGRQRIVVIRPAVLRAIARGRDARTLRRVG